MRLSVALATYNEEQNIRDCLESVANWCDEIIIVDGSSEDNTVNIARKLGAKVIISENVPMFHINKQKAISMAHGDWILQLDADERVGSKLRLEIDEVINRDDADGYWIPRKNYFLGRFLKKGGIYPDYTLRLYKKGQARFPQKSVHEQVTVTGKTGYLINPLIHMADKNLKRYFIRFTRYTDLLAQEIINKRKGPNFIQFFEYVFIRPTGWFLLTYFRHLGFLDSWQGFLFSLFSSLRFPAAYFKSLKIRI